MAQTARPQVSSRMMRAIYDLLDEYKAAVEASPLAENSKVDYISFAEMFVRWLDDDFTPGGTLA